MCRGCSIFYIGCNIVCPVLELLPRRSRICQIHDFLVCITPRVDIRCPCSQTQTAALTWKEAAKLSFLAVTSAVVRSLSFHRQQRLHWYVSDTRSLHQ